MAPIDKTKQNTKHKGFVNSLATLVTAVWTSASRCGNNFCAMGAYGVAILLQGGDIPAGKNYVKRETFKISSKRIFVAIWWETPIWMAITWYHEESQLIVYTRWLQKFRINHFILPTNKWLHYKSKLFKM